MSQHHRALADKIGVVYHWELVTDELTIPVVSHYRRLQTDNGVARTVPVSLPRLTFLRDQSIDVVTVDPTAVEQPKELPPAGPRLCPRGKPMSRFSGQPLEPLEAKVYSLTLDGYGTRAIGRMLEKHESSVRRALLKAKAKMGEYNDPACPEDQVSMLGGVRPKADGWPF